MHQDMTLHTLQWAQAAAQSRKLLLQVRYHGREASDFTALFDWSTPLRQQHGWRRELVPQRDGDLGNKLRQAVDELRSQGVRRAVLIGSDCPELDERILNLAFESLDSHQICFSPALDGGYTLLGLDLEQRYADALACLFKNIDWGTDRVLAQSLAAVAGKGLHVRLLQATADVDRPEDLAVWNSRRLGQQRPACKISVIVPVFGSEPLLKAAIKSGQCDAEIEIIVSAAGESWNALQTAAESKVQYLASKPGRARQMNQAAAIARGEWLLFLHADTQLPQNYAAAVQRVLEEPTNSAGAFRLHIDSKRWQARLVEYSVQLRSRFWGLPYGDQALFLRRATFRQLGGFPDWPLMEDYELARRLRKLGRLVICAESVCTSARRWERLGFLRTTLINQFIVLAYRIGVPLKYLARIYRRPAKGYAANPTPNRSQTIKSGCNEVARD